MEDEYEDEDEDEFNYLAKHGDYKLMDLIKKEFEEILGHTLVIEDDNDGLDDLSWMDGIFEILTDNKHYQLFIDIFEFMKMYINPHKHLNVVKYLIEYDNNKKVSNYLEKLIVSSREEHPIELFELYYEYELKDYEDDNPELIIKFNYHFTKIKGMLNERVNRELNLSPPLYNENGKLIYPGGSEYRKAEESFYRKQQSLWR